MKFERSDLERLRASALFDAQWYREQNPEVDFMDMDPVEHFLRFGLRLGRNPAPDIDAEACLDRLGIGPKQSIWPVDADYLMADLRVDVRDANWIGRFCENLLQESKYKSAVRKTRLLSHVVSGDRRLMALEGVLHLREERYGEAKDAWQKYWNRAATDPSFRTAHPLKLPFDRSGNNVFRTIEANRSEPLEARFCVYTAVYGDYDDVPAPLHKPENIDFICFTDKPFENDGWDVRVFDPGQGDPVSDNRFVKMNPHKVLPNYDYSLYIDANMLLVADISTVARKWLLGNRFVAWPHPERSDIYDELQTILNHLRHEPAGVVDDYQRFRGEDVPSQTGLIEACFLWRSHRDPDVARLMEMWWEEFGRHSRRDQPVLSYCMWKLGVRPAVLPARMGNSRHNDFAVKLEHKRHVLDASSEERAEVSGVGGPAPRSSARKRNIVWLYRSEHGRVASTVMRGRQLSEIYAAVSGEATAYLNETEIGEIRESVVFTTKGFLKKATIDELSALRERGNVVCADYVDDPKRDELDEVIDVFIASSIRQLIDFRRRMPHKRSHMVTHHVDPAIKEITPPNDRLRVGYFGELVNAKYAFRLDGSVSFCLTNTKTMEGDWISQLSNFNMHYAVRENRPIDGFKPFLKGFTAAHCNANILVDMGESDARYYLGSDYPFMLKDKDLESVLAMLELARSSFGGSLWRDGLAAMKIVEERSSFSHIAGEIDSLVAYKL